MKPLLKQRDLNSSQDCNLKLFYHWLPLSLKYNFEMSISTAKDHSTLQVLKVKFKLRCSPSKPSQSSPSADLSLATTINTHCCLFKKKFPLLLSVMNLFLLHVCSSWQTDNQGTSTLVSQVSDVSPCMPSTYLLLEYILRQPYLQAISRNTCHLG